MKREKEKKQNPYFQNDQIEIVADDYRNNETVLKEIEKNTELGILLNDNSNSFINMILN